MTDGLRDVRQEDNQSKTTNALGEGDSMTTDSLGEVREPDD